MAALDLRAMSSALFLPLLYWTGAVVAITLFGYPGVVCMTPLAWLLALPVGLRVQRESTSLGGRVLLEAALAGALLGLFQGLLFAAAMAVSPYVGSGIQSEPANPYLIGFVAVLLGVPVTAVESALIAWVAGRNRAAENEGK